MWTAHQAIAYFHIIQMMNIFPKFAIWRRTWDTDSSESYFSTVQINISDWKIIEILWRRIFLLGFEINNCRDSSLKIDIQKYSEKKHFLVISVNPHFSEFPMQKKPHVNAHRRKYIFMCSLWISIFRLIQSEKTQANTCWTEEICL